MKPSNGIIELSDVNSHIPGKEPPTTPPSAGTKPEGEPARKPGPKVCPGEALGIIPGYEPLTAPPASPQEIPASPGITGYPRVSDELNARKYRSGSKKTLRNINDLLTKKQDPFSLENLHQLRVEIKKLNGVFALLQSMGISRTRARSFKPYLKIFKRSGKLRSAQIEFMIIERYFNGEGSVQYLYDIHQMKTEWLVRLECLLKAGFLKKLKRSRNEISRYIDKLSKKDLQRYLKQQERRLVKSLHRNIFREQHLHDVRKLLKGLYLNLKCGDISSSSRWVDLLRYLGDWHDVQIAFDHIMKAIYGGGLTNYDVTPLHGIKNKLYADKTVLFEKIVLEYRNTFVPTDRPLSKSR